MREFLCVLRISKSCIRETQSSFDSKKKSPYILRNDNNEDNEASIADDGGDK